MHAANLTSMFKSSATPKVGASAEPVDSIAAPKKDSFSNSFQKAVETRRSESTSRQSPNARTLEPDRLKPEAKSAQQPRTEAASPSDSAASLPSEREGIKPTEVKQVNEPMEETDSRGIENGKLPNEVPSEAADTEDLTPEQLEALAAELGLRDGKHLKELLTLLRDLGLAAEPAELKDPRLLEKIQRVLTRVLETLQAQISMSHDSKPGAGRKLSAEQADLIQKLGLANPTRMVSSGDLQKLEQALQQIVTLREQATGEAATRPEQKATPLTPEEQQWVEKALSRLIKESREGDKISESKSERLVPGELVSSAREDRQERDDMGDSRQRRHFQQQQQQQPHLQTNGQIPRPETVAASGEFRPAEGNAIPAHLQDTLKPSQIGERPALQRAYQPTAAWESRIVSQVAKQLNGMVLRNQHEIELRLQPDHLGRVQISLSLQDKNLHGVIRVENETVRQLMENNLSQLRDSMQTQGIQLDSLEVSVSDDKKWQGFGEGTQKSRKEMDSEQEALASASLDATALAMAEGSDTGRRLGYNTLEFIG